MKITYLTHNCFTIEKEDKVFLFDYPSDRYIKDNVKNTISRIAKNSNLFVFISHSHPDHYNPDIFELKEIAEKTYFVLSDDAPLTYGDKSELIKIVEPDEQYGIDGLSVKTYKSNDQGVAFLIELSNIKIYYGGDLAKWNWPEWSEDKRKSKVKIFEDALKRLKKLHIDIAFSNMDERLESWAGPVEFIKKVRPEYFIPMHTFGNEEWIDDLLKENLPDDVDIFKYEKTGDTLDLKK